MKEDDEGNMIVKKDSSEALIKQVQQKINYKRYGYKTAMDEKIFRVGKIKSNFVISLFMLFIT